MTLLSNNRLLLRQLYLKQIKDGVRRLRLLQVKQDLQQEEKRFDLQERLNRVQLLQHESQVPERRAQILRLVAHRRTVEHQHRVELLSGDRLRQARIRRREGLFGLRSAEGAR